MVRKRKEGPDFHNKEGGEGCPRHCFPGKRVFPQWGKKSVQSWKQKRGVESVPVGRDTFAEPLIKLDQTRTGAPLGKSPGQSPSSGKNKEGKQPTEAFRCPEHREGGNARTTGHNLVIREKPVRLGNGRWLKRRRNFQRASQKEKKEASLKKGE